MSYKWPTSKKESDHMLMRQNQNMVNTFKNPNENWFSDKLSQCNHKFSRQRRWGYRLFDFWCHSLGLAIEIDGPDHNAEHDKQRDLIEFKRSRILVFRVRNKNEDDARRAIEFINSCTSWNHRRLAAGMKPILT